MRYLLLLLPLFNSLNAQERAVREVSSTAVKSTIDLSLETLISDKQLKNASVSFLVYDIDNDKEICSHNPHQALVTASTMKVVTTATALEILGSWHQFETRLSYDGFIDSNCTLRGNIYIQGGGDPTIGSKYFKENKNFMEDWVQEIANLGIHQIEGKIIGDASYFSDEYVPSTWGWGDMGNYYGTGVSGLTYKDNTIHFEFQSGKEHNDSTWVTCYEPYTPDLKIDNRVLAGNTKKDEAYIFGGPYNKVRTIKGRIPKNKEGFNVKGSMHDPTYSCAFELETALWKMGIEVTESASTIRRERLNGVTLTSTKKRSDFATFKSPSVSKIVYWTNLISYNLYAETLLKHIGVKRYKDGSVFSSTTAISEFWTKKGLDMTGFYMNDGSGLSRANAVSAKNLVEVMVYMKTKSKYFDSFYSSLPIAGKTGTLKNYGKGSTIMNNLRAKSGTMTRVKSFTGYVKSKSGKQLAFAIIVNNYNCTTYQIGKKLERLMISLGDYNQ